jgi:hypothetical protein
MYKNTLSCSFDLGVTSFTFMASYIDETSITNIIQEINILSNYIQDINNLYNNVKESLMNPLVNLVSTNNNIQIPNFPEHGFKPIT